MVSKYTIVSNKPELSPLSPFSPLGMTQLLLPALLCGILARYFSLGFVLLLNVKHRFPQTPVPKTMNLILVSDLLNYYLHRRNRHVAQPHVQTNYYGLLLPLRHALLATYNYPCSIPWNMYWCAYIITLVSWCHLRRIRRRNEIIFFFSCLQLDVLRSLKMNSTMNIVDNYRPVQNLGSRKVKSSFSSTQAPPTATAVPVATEAASVALKISNVLLMLVLFLGEVFCHWMICKTRFSAWGGGGGRGGGGRGGNNADLSAVQFGGCAGWSRKRLCYTRLYIQ